MNKTDHLKEAIVHITRARLVLDRAHESSLAASCDELVSDVEAAIKAEKRAVDALEGETRG